MEALYLIIASVLPTIGTIVGVVIGAKVGQAVANGDKIETPKLNPFKAIQEHQDRKQAEREQERYDAIMRNIENYNGTDQGQEDVPRG